MTLKDWMNESGISVKTLADQLGCTVSMVYLVLSGGKAFGRKKMKKIVELSGGAVTYEDLIGEEPAA